VALPDPKLSFTPPLLLNGGTDHQLGCAGGDPKLKEPDDNEFVVNFEKPVGETPKSETGDALVRPNSFTLVELGDGEFKGTFVLVPKSPPGVVAASCPKGLRLDLPSEIAVAGFERVVIPAPKIPSAGALSGVDSDDDPNLKYSDGSSGSFRLRNGFLDLVLLTFGG